MELTIKQLKELYNNDTIDGKKIKIITKAKMIILNGFPDCGYADVIFKYKNKQYFISVKEKWFKNNNDDSRFIRCIEW